MIMVTYGCLAGGESSDGMKHQTMSSTSRRRAQAFGIELSCGTRQDSGSASRKGSSAFARGRFVDFTLPGQILKADL